MADTKRTTLILDVRSTASYTKKDIKGSLSLPLFDKDNKLPDDLAKAFTEYVTAHKADFKGKTIYVLCNSGARGLCKKQLSFSKKPESPTYSPSKTVQKVK